VGEEMANNYSKRKTKYTVYRKCKSESEVKLTKRGETWRNTIRLISCVVVAKYRSKQLLIILKLQMQRIKGRGDPRPRKLAKLIQINN
jgi:hypothetical protein